MDCENVKSGDLVVVTDELRADEFVAFSPYVYVEDENNGAFLISTDGVFLFTLDGADKSTMPTLQTVGTANEQIMEQVMKRYDRHINWYLKEIKQEG